MYSFIINQDYLFIDHHQDINVIYLSEYDDLDLPIYPILKENKFANWYILKYDQIFQLGAKISLNNYYEFTNDFVKFIDQKNVVIMGHGFGGLLANYFNYLESEKYLATILINPITSKGYLNPYVSDKPSYKFNKKAIYLQLSKQYYYLTDIYGDFYDDRFNAYVQKITMHWDYFDTLRGFLSDYINLNLMYKIELRIPSNTYLLLGNDDQIIDPQITYHWLRNNNPSIMILNMTNASHYLFVDQTRIFNDILISILKKVKVQHETECD